MSFGVQIWNSAGVSVYDSSAAVGGVIADVKTYAAGATATLTYPAYPGRSVEIIPLISGNDTANYNVTTDTTLGYPRVTVASSGAIRKFAVEVY